MINILQEAVVTGVALTLTGVWVALGLVARVWLQGKRIVARCH